MPPEERKKKNLYLNAHDNAPVLDHLGKRSAIVCILVKRLVEEDDASDAFVYALVGREEELAVQAAVLFRVLNANGVQALGHAACLHTQPQIYCFMPEELLQASNLCNSYNMYTLK